MNASRPLSELATIDWGELEHSYGTAGDVPDMLRSLLSDDPDTRDGARAALHASLDHQGVRRFEATLCAVPFLVGLLADPEVPERGEIARLLAELAVGDTCWFLYQGFHPDLQTACDGSARPQACAEVHAASFATRGFPELDDGRLDMAIDSGLRRIYHAVAAGVPIYVAALADGDEGLRAALPFLLAFLTTEAVQSVGALHWLLDDPAETVRASAMLGLSHASKFSASLRDEAFAALAARWGRDLGDLERRCLALALVRTPNPRRTAPALSYLQGCLRDSVPGVLPDDRFPWFRIDSAPFLYASAWSGSVDADRPALLDAARQCLRQLENPHDAADLAVWIARHHIGELHRPLDPRRIDPELHETLGALADSAAAWRYTDLGSALETRGVPSDRAALTAWLAAAPAPAPAPAARKAPAKVKKPAGKKPAAVKKPADRKSARKKSAGKKPVARKSPGKTPSARKAAANRAPAAKTPVNPRPAKKSAAEKAVPKKARGSSRTVSKPRRI